MAQSEPKHDSAADRKIQGLKRLSAAVGSMTTVRYCSGSRPAQRARLAEFCLLWRPEDTYESFAAKHPEWGNAQQVQARIWRLRRKLPSLPRGVVMSGYRVAQAYLLSLPEHLRRPTSS